MVTLPVVLLKTKCITGAFDTVTFCARMELHLLKNTSTGRAEVLKLLVHQPEFPRPSMDPEPVISRSWRFVAEIKGEGEVPPGYFPRGNARRVAPFFQQDVDAIGQKQRSAYKYAGRDVNRCRPRPRQLL